MDADLTLPEFDLATNGGGRMTQDDLSGKWTLLYFYPKDNTPGCTQQAIGFTEKSDAFEQLGVQIVGVSKDSVKKHDNFVEKHQLKIPLISDPDGVLVEGLGVWVEKKMYGKTYMGIERSSFLIGPDLKIYNKWSKVKPSTHGDDLLSELPELIN